MAERRIEPARTDHVVRLKGALREKLGRVCRHFPESDFEALLERIALIEIKYTMRADIVGLRRRNDLDYAG